MAKPTMNCVNNGRTPLELSQISFKAVKNYENILSFEVKIKNVQRGINKKTTGNSNSVHIPFLK